MSFSKRKPKKRMLRMLLTATASAGVLSMLGVSMASTRIKADEITDLQVEKNNSSKEVDSLQKQLNDYMTKLNDLEIEAGNLGEDIEKSKEELAAAEEEQKKQYEEMKLRIQYMYENKNAEVGEAILTSEDMGDMLNKSEYYQRIVNYDRDSLAQLAETAEKIKTLNEKQVEDMKKLAASQSEAQSKVSELNGLIEEKKSSIADLNDRIAEAQAVAARKAAEEAEKARAAEAARSASSSTSRSSNTSRSSSGSSSGTGTSSGSGRTSSSIDGSSIIAAARSMLGTPYVWGGASTSGVDCSGLVMLCYRTQGISLPHSSAAMAGYGRGVSVSEAQPGDIVCYPGHVGIYAGNGQMIHAPTFGQTVSYTSIYAVGTPTSIRRL